MYRETPGIGFQAPRGSVFLDISCFASVQDLISSERKASPYQIVDLCHLVDAVLLHDNLYVLSVKDEVYDATAPDAAFMGDFAKRLPIEVIVGGYPKKEEVMPEIMLDKELLNQFENLWSLRMQFPFIYGMHSKSPLKDDFVRYIQSFGINTPSSIEALAQAYRLQAHLDMSRKARIYYCPHSLRIPIVKHKLKLALQNVSFARSVISRIEASEGIRVQELNKALGFDAFTFDLPILLSLVLNQCKGPKDIIDEMLNLRDKDSELGRFRRWCKEFEQTAAMGDKAKALKMNEDLASYCASLGVKERATLSSEVIPQISLSPDAIFFEIMNKVVIQKTVGRLVKRLKYKNFFFLETLKRRMSTIANSEADLQRVFRERIDDETIRSVKQLAAVDQSY